jgi:hypothetical protein
MRGRLPRSSSYTLSTVPLAEPVALYPWSMVHRRDARSRGIQAVEAAARRLEGEEAWLSVPGGAWLPEPERARLARDIGAQ